MNQLKLKIFFIFSIILFLPFAANARVEDCSTTKFSDGTTSKILTFPAGGGYNTDAKVSLPMSASIGATKVDLAPKTLIGTPYIWVPKSIVNGQIVQIDTKTGIVVNTYNVGNNPSRVTVMPGGDVWVANRNSANLTRLSPAAAPNYSVNGTYPVGSGPRGVTFDYKGNIWAFDYYDNTVWKFTAPGYASSSFANGAGYPYIYGAIGDAYGYIWMIGDLNNPGTGNRRLNILDTKTNAITIADACTLNGSNYLYGIGMDNQGNILVNNYGGGGTCKIGGAKSGANFGKVIQTLVGPSGSRGVAVDGNNNVWVANSVNNHVYVYNSAGTQLKDLVPGTDFGNYTDMIGVAIDFDNNAWVVSNGSGRVLKFRAVGAANQYTVIYNINIGGSLYNYSDMTGFRSIPTTLTVGSTEFTPTAGTTYTGFGLPLQAALVACSCPDVNGVEQCAEDPSRLDSCLVPLSLFSVTGGTYNATNLSIACSITYPDITGGLVPCGRIDDNLATGDIDESAPCTLCALFYMLKNIINFVLGLAVGIGVFILIIAGLLYGLSAGNPRNIELAKSAVTSAIIGIAIIFIAWLAIAVILQALGYANIGAWNQVNCILPLPMSP